MVRIKGGGAILEKELRPPKHFGVVALEKGVFVPSSITVA